MLLTEEISVHFGGIQAISFAGFEACAGQVTGLIGPNGAGKTTMFNVITGLQRPNTGRVILEGADVTRMRPRDRARKGIGRTFQRLEVFGSLTVKDNVMVALEARRSLLNRRDRPQRADELLSRVGLTGSADTLAEVLPTGTARLLELARAFDPSPRLWVDIGCGVGYLLAEVRKNGYDVCGVEPDPQARAAAQSANAGVQVTDELGDLRLGGEKAGVVSMLDVLEHVPADKLEATAASVRRLLAPSGVWIVKVPSSDGPYFRVAHVAARIAPRLMWPFIERLWQLRFPSPHFVYFNERSARSFVERHGFELVRTAHFPAVPMRSALARLSMDDTIPRWKALCALPLIAVLNAFEAASKKGDSLVLFARPQGENQGEAAS